MKIFDCHTFKCHYPSHDTCIQFLPGFFSDFEIFLNFTNFSRYLWQTGPIWRLKGGGLDKLLKFSGNELGWSKSASSWLNKLMILFWTPEETCLFSSRDKTELMGIMVWFWNKNSIFLEKVNTSLPPDCHRQAKKLIQFTLGKTRLFLLLIIVRLSLAKISPKTSVFGPDPVKKTPKQIAKSFLRLPNPKDLHNPQVQSDPDLRLRFWELAS